MENSADIIRDEQIPRMVTIREASRITGLSYNFLQTECRNGNLVCFRVGASGKYLINLDFLIDQMHTARGAIRKPEAEENIPGEPLRVL